MIYKCNDTAELAGRMQNAVITAARMTALIAHTSASDAAVLLCCKKLLLDLLLQANLRTHVLSFSKKAAQCKQRLPCKSVL